jgi:hypothetical protein
MRRIKIFLITVCGVIMFFSCRLLPDMQVEPVFVFTSEAPDTIIYVGVEYHFKRPNYTGVRNIIKPPYFLVILPVSKGGIQQTFQADFTKPDMTWKEFFDYVQTDTITLLCAKDMSSILKWHENHVDSLIYNRHDLTRNNFNSSKDLIYININNNYQFCLKP